MIKRFFCCDRHRWTTLVLLLCCATSVAQPYNNLVFEGAGIRGVAYAGVVRELENRQLLTHLKKVGGTSAGAIAALLVALGYSSDEIEALIYNTRLQRFNDGHFSVIGGAHRMKNAFGWYSHGNVLAWLDQIIETKTSNGDITFRELHEQHFPDLYVTGTSLNHQKLIVFSCENYPDMKVKDAVCISMSIPLYFVSLCIDERGHLIDGRKATGHYDIMADGGFTSNFPIAMFDSAFTTTTGITRVYNPSTLGFRIDSPEQIRYDREHLGLAPVEIHRFRDYMNAFYTFTIENLNRTALTPEDWKRTVSISAGHIGPKIRRLSAKEKDLLIGNGQQAVQLFLD